jgi:two-component system, NarL family, response regulator LiaR
MIRLLLVDDHAVVRQGLRMFLELDPEMSVVGEAIDGSQALEVVETCKPDVVLMDLLMPRMSGLETIRRLSVSHPNLVVLALTSSSDERSVTEAMKAGARGYLLKDTQAADLCSAIRAAISGRVQLSPEAAAGLVQGVRSQEPSWESLTTRERQVLEFLAAGSSNKEIATQLNLVEKTVKTHVSNLLSKLGLHSRTQAALYAVQRGWIQS